jgi:hypothetical protein
MTDPGSPQSFEPTSLIPPVGPGDPAAPPPPGDLPPTAPPPGDTPGKQPPWLPIAIAALAVAVLALVVVLLVTNDDDNEAADTVPAASTTSIDTTTTSVEDTTTTSATTTSTTMPDSTTSTVPAPSVDRTQVVFPADGAGIVFTDPFVAAQAFAVDYLGFTNPLVSPFRQGDTTSGEVEVRAVEGGVPTVILLRTFDGTQWFVTGAANENIVVDTPEPGATVASPLLLTGQVFAFEGTVNVQIIPDNQTEPLYEGIVMGGGSELLPFTSTVEWPAPTSGAGAVVFREFGPKEGEVLNAAVVRVLFGGTGS